MGVVAGLGWFRRGLGGSGGVRVVQAGLGWFRRGCGSSGGVVDCKFKVVVDPQPP